MESEQMTEHGLRFVQIALNTSDPAGTLRLYCEAFGSVAGGGNAFWGDAVRTQGLGREARGTVWWLVGRQPFLQFEIFNHTVPPQRPLPRGNLPSDIGWTRFGIAVTDFDQALRALVDHGVKTITEPVLINGLRRVSFRDPFVGCFVEVFEDGRAVPGRSAPYVPDPSPAIVYAACSVSNLDAARNFYGNILGLEILARDMLHGPEHEALWGLNDAICDGFLLRLGEVFVEVVQYQTPKARAKAPDHRITDQGIMNIAFGSRNIPSIQKLAAKIEGQGIGCSEPTSIDIAFATYVMDSEREVELIGLDEAADEVFGFVPGKPFFAG